MTCSLRVWYPEFDLLVLTATPEKRGAVLSSFAKIDLGTFSPQKSIEATVVDYDGKNFVDMKFLPFESNRKEAFCVGINQLDGMGPNPTSDSLYTFSQFGQILQAVDGRYLWWRGKVDMFGRCHGRSTTV
jgi:hypothetical protein